MGGVLYTMVGRDFYPLVDAGQIKLHVRAPAGMRLEETSKVFAAVEQKIHDVIPQEDIALVVDESACRPTPTTSPSPRLDDRRNDGTILISRQGEHAPTQDYIKRLRVALPEAFPSVIFYFQAADMVTRS